MPKPATKPNKRTRAHRDAFDDLFQRGLELNRERSPHDASYERLQLLWASKQRRRDDFFKQNDDLPRVLKGIRIDVRPPTKGGR